MSSDTLAARAPYGIQPRTDEATTQSAIRLAALHMVASCSEDTLAAVVATLMEQGEDAYAVATRMVVEGHTLLR